MAFLSHLRSSVRLVVSGKPIPWSTVRWCNRRCSSVTTDRISPKKQKVIVGMSGGVDSSVVAYVLSKQEKYVVEGLFMHNWDVNDEEDQCSADKDYKDMMDVCTRLNIKGHRVSFVKEYWNDVFEEFVNSYEKGFTPNPDVFCNREIKFKAFLTYATKTLGADKIATGHYAQVISSPAGSKFQLTMAADKSKDQTYFLSAIDPACLSRVMFPIGHLCKTEVRKIASLANLTTVANKKDSTGICFVGKRNFPDFIKKYIEPTPGPIMHLETGRVLGTHSGIHTRTLGERSRLQGMPQSMYVVDKKMDSNALIVAVGHEHPALYRNWLTCTTFYWMGIGPMPHRFRCQVRARYQQRLAWATLTQVDTDTCDTPPCHHPNKPQVQSGNPIQAKVSVLCEFDNPHYTVTPGQMLVAYDDTVCLGGGVIDGLGPTVYETETKHGSKLSK
eukprot:CFRG1452T1